VAVTRVDATKPAVSESIPRQITTPGDRSWTGRAERWARFTVPVAYDLRYDTYVRPVMGENQVSRKAVLAVAEARSHYAENGAGRGSRPTNERLAADTGYSVRTVQRADTALRLLGVATEVLRGRQRTRTERLASWRVGDRGRGWASVWALHDDAQLARLVGALSPQPEGFWFFTLPKGDGYYQQPPPFRRR
jgi:hypothetical protein